MPNVNNSLQGSPGTSDSLSAAQRAAVGAVLSAYPVAEELGSRFRQAGFALALVGGSVRDALLGRLGNDLDFTTDARPEQVLQLLKPWADAVWDVGIAFGTVGARKRARRPPTVHTTVDFQIEITTYRSEAYDRDSRKPEVSYGDTIEEDLVRRDFTVNAMAVALPEQRVRRPARRPGRPGRAGAAHPGHPGAVLLRRPAADAAGGPLRRPARTSRSPPRWSPR